MASRSGAFLFCKEPWPCPVEWGEQSVAADWLKFVIAPTPRTLTTAASPLYDRERPASRAAPSLSSVDRSPRRPPPPGIAPPL